jgi:hypothetical protein
MAARRYEVASQSDGLGFRGVIEKKHALVCQRFIRFLDTLSVVAKGRRAGIYVLASVES